MPDIFCKLHNKMEHFEDDKPKDVVERCPHTRRHLPPHICPYRDDVNGDSETLCNCCEDCTHECAMDI